MAATKQNNSQNFTATETDADVLYQKLGDRWFAFSVINDEVFMAPVTEENMQEINAVPSPSAGIKGYDL